MPDNDEAPSAEQRAWQYAEQLGRASFFVGQLVALAQLGTDAPADYLREQLTRLADQATRYDLVTPEEAAEDLARLRQDVELWKAHRANGGAGDA